MLPRAPLRPALAETPSLRCHLRAPSPRRPAAVGWPASAPPRSPHPAQRTHRSAAGCGGRRHTARLGLRTHAAARMGL